MFGLVQALVSPQISELAIWAGFDFLILDCEHGVADEAGHLACLATAQNYPAFVAVRLRKGDLAAVGRYADWGADALLMPDVGSVGEAEAFVAAARPGKSGSRSSASLTRAGHYGLRAPASPPLLLAMIESAAGVAAADGIAAAGVDGLVIGPSDLSADLGLPYASDAYRIAFEQVEQAARARGKILGSRFHPPFDRDRLVAGGHRFILAASDLGILAGGLRAAAMALHENAGR